MSWIDILDRNIFLRSLFEESDPSLDVIKIMRFELEPRDFFRLSFELSEYPKAPPEKWKECNTVQVTLRGALISSFTVDGWPIENTGRLEIKGNSPSIRIRFLGNDCRFYAEVEWLSVDKVSAYIDGAR